MWREKMSKRTRVAAAVVALAASAVVASPAFASGPNYGTSWESWLLGARVNGHVQIQPSYLDGGGHARQGYQRFMRQAGPSLDTGRLYTPVASSAYDTSIYYNDAWVWDSPLWGDAYTTHYYWGINSWF